MKLPQPSVLHTAARFAIELDAILKAIEPLKQLLPEEGGLDEETNRRLCELFNIEYVPIDKNA
jgi:hypothetical protein